MSTHKYELELISLTNSPDTTKFRIRVVGTREYFIKNLQEIYIPEYLDNLSNENCCYLGYLHGSLSNKNTMASSMPLKQTKSKISTMKLFAFNHRSNPTPNPKQNPRLGKYIKRSETTV